MTPRIKYIILGLTLYFCRFNANGQQFKIHWEISNDSVQNERHFKDVEIELITNCLSIRKLNLECDSVHSNILIDSVVQSMCNLNLSLVKSFFFACMFQLPRLGRIVIFTGQTQYVPKF